MTSEEIGLVFSIFMCLICQPVFAEQALSDSNGQKPALTVTVVRPNQQSMPLGIFANGSIAAWQEAVIGAEVADLRLADVKVQVGDVVKKGQILAVFADDQVQIDIAHKRAILAEAEAALTEARLNANRTRKFGNAGPFSAQQVEQYLTSEKTAAAKVQAAKAQLDADLLRAKKTRVLASDDGVISSRSATLGAVAGMGQELFRLIRKNRMEWRAEVTAEELVQLKPGISVQVEIPHVGRCDGKIRSIAPSVDVQSRNGLVYVDLPDAATKGLKPGMFAKGEFRLGSKVALTLPQQAVLLREGFNYVYRVYEPAGDKAKVAQIKVEVGRREQDNVEILSGIDADHQFVAGGVSFLADGDVVRMVKE